RWEQALSRMEDASVRITAGSAPEDGASVPERLREQERENVELHRRAMRQEAQTLVETEQQMRQPGYPGPAHTPTQTAMIKAVTQCAAECQTEPCLSAAPAGTTPAGCSVHAARGCGTERMAVGAGSSLTPVLGLARSAARPARRPRPERHWTRRG